MRSKVNDVCALTYSRERGWRWIFRQKSSQLSFLILYFFSAIVIAAFSFLFFFCPLPLTFIFEAELIKISSSFSFFLQTGTTVWLVQATCFCWLILNAFTSSRPTFTPTKSTWHRQNFTSFLTITGVLHQQCHSSSSHPNQLYQFSFSFFFVAQRPELSKECDWLCLRDKGGYTFS